MAGGKLGLGLFFFGMEFQPMLGERLMTTEEPHSLSLPPTIPQMGVE